VRGYDKLFHACAGVRARVSAWCTACS
jgi:hypothetical protein